MTDIVIEGGGYAGGFLDTIVDFNFGQRFATVTFQAIWDGDAPKTNSPLISIPQLGIINQQDFGKTGTIIRSVLYHKETKGSYQPPDTTTTVYNTIVTTISPVGISFGQTTVTSSGGFSFWAAGAAGGSGDINAWVAYELSQPGVDTASATIFSGPTTNTPPRIPTYNEVDNAVYIINLSVAKKQVKPNVTALDFTFNTGTGPVLVPGFQGAVDYNWTSTFQTFGSARFISFPVSTLALPAGVWPKPKTTEFHKSVAGTPVPNQALDYKIPL